MSGPVDEASSHRDLPTEKHQESLASATTSTPDGSKRIAADAPALDVKALTDHTLHFLATASNETLGACLVGLGAGTYFILGRVGLVIIGVVGGVVLHATWEGNTQNGDDKDRHRQSAEARRRELAVDIAHRVLDWRNRGTSDKSSGEDDDSDLNLKLYSGQNLDYSSFKPETAAALTELTDAVIRDYVKYVVSCYHPAYLSNANAGGGTRLCCLPKKRFQTRVARLLLPLCSPYLRICHEDGRRTTLSTLLRGRRRL